MSPFFKLQNLSECYNGQLFDLIRLRNPFQTRHIAWFKHVPQAPPDPVFGVVEQFMKCTAKNKVNLSIGVYRDDNNNPFVFRSVRTAEERIFSRNMDKEYAGIGGNKTFCKLAFELAMGEENEYLQNNRVTFIHTPAGGGALAVAAIFLSRFFPENKVIYMSEPVWDNDVSVFRAAGLTVKRYRYYDPTKVAFDWEGMREDLQNFPCKSIILLHASNHNPTGFDPNQDQWQEIAHICKERKYFVVFDAAYLGLGKDIDTDCYSIRTLADAGINMFICQSFSKNMGLYGERTGCLSFISDSSEEIVPIHSQLLQIARFIYSNPPIHGARIAVEILSDDKLKCQWLKELNEVSNRLITMRQQLRDKLLKEGSKLSWDHIIQQHGMFSYTGFSIDVILKLRRVFHIYLLDNGRVCVASLNSKNIDHIAKCFHKATSKN